MAKFKKNDIVYFKGCTDTHVCENCVDCVAEAYALVDEDGYVKGKVVRDSRSVLSVKIRTSLPKAYDKKRDGSTCVDIFTENATKIKSPKSFNPVEFT
jgi:hypothetical protein